jgi:hypothetical protein
VQGGGGDSAHGGVQRVHTGAPDRPLSDSGGGSHLGPRCRASTWAQQRRSSHGNQLLHGHASWEFILLLEMEVSKG